MVMVNLYHKVSEDFISETSYVELIKLRSVAQDLLDCIMIEKRNVLNKIKVVTDKLFFYNFYDHPLPSIEVGIRLDEEYARLNRRYKLLRRVEDILTTNLCKIGSGIYLKGPNILHAYDTCNKSYDIGTAKWAEINKYRNIANISDEIPVSDLSLIFDRYEDEDALVKRFYEC